MMRRLKEARPPFLIGLAFLIIWEIGVRSFDVPHYILPGPLLIIETLWNDSALLMGSLWVTLEITIVALLAAALGGIGEDAPAMGDMGALAPPPPLPIWTVGSSLLSPFVPGAAYPPLDPAEGLQEPAPSPPSPAQTRNAHRKRKDYQRDNAQTLARDKLVAQRRHASQPRTPATASRFCAASATRGPRSCAATDLGSAPAVVFDAKQNAAAAQRHHRENRQNSTGRQFKQREPGSRKRKPGQATPQVTLRRPATRPGPPQPKQQPLLEQMAVDGAQGEAELPRRFGHQPRNLLGEYSST